MWERTPPVDVDDLLRVSRAHPLRSLDRCHLGCPRVARHLSGMQVPIDFVASYRKPGEWLFLLLLYLLRRARRALLRPDLFRSQFGIDRGNCSAEDIQRE